ncbi:hypothetical protein [Enterococcus sp. HY326]|nr:hypothetical protein [Enterococcus sp. HY326]
MGRWLKITNIDHYQRYHVSFSHAIGFTWTVLGRSVSKNSIKQVNQ